MAKGTWLLIFTQFDEMENREPEFEDRIVLTASTEKDAIAEALAHWKLLLRKPYRGWNDQVYPKKPRLIYETKVEWPTAA